MSNKSKLKRMADLAGIIKEVDARLGYDFEKANTRTQRAPKMTKSGDRVADDDPDPFGEEEMDEGYNSGVEAYEKSKSASQQNKVPKLPPSQVPDTDDEDTPFEEEDREGASGSRPRLEGVNDFSVDRPGVIKDLEAEIKRLASSKSDKKYVNGLKKQLKKLKSTKKENFSRFKSLATEDTPYRVNSTEPDNPDEPEEDEMKESIKPGQEPKVEKTKHGYQVMVYSPKTKGYIPQGQPHRSEKNAEKDLKGFYLNVEGCDVDERDEMSIKVKKGMKPFVKKSKNEVDEKGDIKDEDKIIDPKDAEDYLDEGKYTFKPNQSITYQKKPWTVKKATRDWVELEDKRGFTTIVDFDDIKTFKGNTLMVERDEEMFVEELNRMHKMMGYDESPEYLDEGLEAGINSIIKLINKGLGKAFGPKGNKKIGDSQIKKLYDVLSDVDPAFIELIAGNVSRDRISKLMYNGKFRVDGEIVTPETMNAKFILYDIIADLKSYHKSQKPGKRSVPK